MSILDEAFIISYYQIEVSSLSSCGHYIVSTGKLCVKDKPSKIFVSLENINNLCFQGRVVRDNCCNIHIIIFLMFENGIYFSNQSRLEKVREIVAFSDIKIIICNMYIQSQVMEGKGDDKTNSNCCSVLGKISLKITTFLENIFYRQVSTWFKFE